MKKREKAGFLSPTTSKFALTKEKKERGGRKEEKKKSNGCTLAGRKRTIWQQRFLKNPARYIDSYLVENVQELQTI